MDQLFIKQAHGRIRRTNCLLKPMALVAANLRLGRLDPG